MDDARIVAPFDDQLAVFLRIRIDGILALTDGRRRFNGQAEDKGHAVGNAAVNAAVVIGLGLYDAIIVIESIVACEPRRPVKAKPSPNSMPFTAGTENIM